MSATLNNIYGGLRIKEIDSGSDALWIRASIGEPKFVLKRNAALQKGAKLVMENGSGRQTTIIANDDAPEEFTMKLPTSMGSANQYMKTDGNNTLFWDTVTLSTTPFVNNNAITVTDNANQLLNESQWFLNSNIMTGPNGFKIESNNGDLTMTFGPEQTNTWRIKASGSEGKMYYMQYDGSEWITRFTVRS